MDNYILIALIHQPKFQTGTRADKCGLTQGCLCQDLINTDKNNNNLH